MTVTCELAVRVVPRASKAGVAGTRDHAILVRIAAAPVDGAANAELIETLARALRPLILRRTKAQVANASPLTSARSTAPAAAKVSLFRRTVFWSR